MKTLLIALIAGLSLSASAQYWTTNTTITTVTNLVPQITTNELGQVWQEVPVVRSITNQVITPILVTNVVRFTLTAQAEAELREVFQLMKDGGEVTGSFNAWFDSTANQVVSQAMTTRSGELSAKKEERLLNLWRKASANQQTNVVELLK